MHTEPANEGPVRVRLMGEPQLLTGHVESISAGIADRERSDSPDLLANINPTFTWVRLAQRVPVRVKLDGVPPGFSWCLAERQRCT
jgi:multidrug resistance efflux pump